MNPNKIILPIDKCFMGCILARLIFENNNGLLFDDLLELYRNNGFMAGESDLIEQLDLLFNDNLIQITDIQTNEILKDIKISIMANQQRISLTEIGKDKTKAYIEVFKQFPQVEQSILGLLML